MKESTSCTIPIRLHGSEHQGKLQSDSTDCPEATVSYLQLLEHHGAFLGAIVAEKEACRLYARGIVLHVDRDGAAGLGASADRVELEAHEGLDQGWDKQRRVPGM